MAEEREYLNLFDFSVNLATHFDFFETFVSRIESQVNNLLVSENENEVFINFAKQMINPLSSMSLMLVKMSIQCLDFCGYSPSTVVLASLYAATAFVKHSKTYKGEFTTRFC